MDFGVPERVLTQFLKSELVRVRSDQEPHFSYLFRRSKPPYEVDGIFKSVWSCITCEKLRKQDIRQNIDSSVCRLHIQHIGDNETMMLENDFLCALYGYTIMTDDN